MNSGKEEIQEISHRWGDGDCIAEWIWKGISVELCSLKMANKKGNFKAFCTIQYGQIKITGIKIVEGGDGLFLSMPSRSYIDKNGNSKYMDFVFLEQEFKNWLNKVVLNEYNNNLTQED